MCIESYEYEQPMRTTTKIDCMFLTVHKLANYL